MKISELIKELKGWNKDFEVAVTIYNQYGDGKLKDISGVDYVGCNTISIDVNKPVNKEGE